MQYAVLITQPNYPEQFELSDLPMHHDTSNTLITFTAKFHEAFMKGHSGMCFRPEKRFSLVVCCVCTEHRCNSPGGGDVLVLNGNMKNHRSVCYADKAGYMQYEGLPGKLCTGCPNTPAKQSLYCNLHKPLISSHHMNSSDNATE